MRLNEVVYSNAAPVEGYGEGFFRLGGEVFHGPICVLASGVSAWGGYDDYDGFVAIADELDVLFVGTGKEIAHIPSAFREALEQAGIGVEIMASPAACRTYNVLLSEGRRVGMALMPV